MVRAVECQYKGLTPIIYVNEVIKEATLGNGTNISISLMHWPILNIKKKVYG